MAHSVTRRDSRSWDPDPRVTRTTSAEAPSIRAPSAGSSWCCHRRFVPSDPHPSLLG